MQVFIGTDYFLSFLSVKVEVYFCFVGFVLIHINHNKSALAVLFVNVLAVFCRVTLSVLQGAFTARQLW